MGKVEQLHQLPKKCRLSCVEWNELQTSRGLLTLWLSEYAPPQYIHDWVHFERDFEPAIYGIYGILCPRLQIQRIGAS